MNSPVLRSVISTSKTLVRLGDYVTKTEETERSPLETGLDRYIKVEHLDRDQLRIVRWGSILEDELPPTFYKVFRKGQVLYPTRNPHLRRTAYASFDGICGEKTLTLSAKSGMEPKFLPFVFQTEDFIAYATSVMIGSTNPHVRWRDIAKFEFPLPPLEEQKRIAEILWAADEAVEKWHRVQTRAVTAMVTTRRDMFRRLSTSTASTSIRNVGHWVSGGTPSRSRRDYWNGEFPWVSPKDMKRDLIIESEEKITELALQNRINILPAESVMIVVRGMILAHTFPVALAGREVTINQDMKGIVPNEDFLPIYVFHWFKDNAERILQSMEESTHGTKRLATDVLFEMQIPKADLTEQAYVTSVLETFRKQIERIIEHIEKTKRVKSRLLNSGLVGNIV